MPCCQTRIRYQGPGKIKVARDLRLSTLVNERGKKVEKRVVIREWMSGVRGVENGMFLIPK